MKLCLSFYEWKETPIAIDTKVTLDLSTLRVRHFHSPCAINKKDDPGAGQKNGRKADRFLAECLTNSSEIT